MHCVVLADRAVNFRSFSGLNALLDPPFLSCCSNISCQGRMSVCLAPIDLVLQDTIAP